MSGIRVQPDSGTGPLVPGPGTLNPRPREDLERDDLETGTTGQTLYGVDTRLVIFSL